jgi:YegS/Rv2252/BmrU family lipid kinase
VTAKPFLVVNPHSAGGWTGRHFDRILRAVRAELGEVEWAFTQSAGDGARLAGEAFALGRRLIVAVGGDGTASEVIDGLGQAGAMGNPALEVGFIPHGTGGDLRRSLGHSEDVAAAARALACPESRRIDLGRAELVGPDGRPLVRHFVNVATCGVSAVVAGHVNAGRRFGSGKLTFFVASARAMLTWYDRRLRWRADGGGWREEPITALSCCNGRYFGGGMKVAPDAALDDGRFDVVIWKGYGPIDLVLQRPKLYDGRHVQLAKTEVLRAAVVELEPVGGPPMALDLDGEQPGLLPARLTVLPAALRVRCGPGRTPT